MSEPFKPPVSQPITSGNGGTFGNLTNTLADSIEAQSKGAVSSVTVAKATPWIAGGLGALTGYLLLDPAVKLSKMAFGGLKTLVTGFGAFEKIPLVGGLFKGIGEAMDTVGGYAGNAVPLLAGVLGYKAFQAQDRLPLTPSSNIGRVGHVTTTQKLILTTPDLRRATELELPEPPPPVTRSPAVVAKVQEIAELPSPPGITQAVAARAKIQATGNKDNLDSVMQEYLSQEMQIYEDNREFARFTARDRERDTVNHMGDLFKQGQKDMMQNYGLSATEAAAFIPQSPLLRGTIYANGDHHIQAGFSPLDDINYLNKGPLADFGREFQRTYGEGLIPVNDGSDKQATKSFDLMTTSQQFEFLSQALAFAKKRKKEILKELEYNAQQQGSWSSVNGSSYFATNGSFNYMDMRNGPSDTFATVRAYNELTYDPRTELSARQDYTPAPPSQFTLKVVPRGKDWMPTEFVSTELPPYAILRSNEHAFLMKVDGVGKDLQGELWVPLNPLSSGSSHDQYDNREISLGKLDGVTVRGEGNGASARFIYAENGTGTNLNRVFEQWQKDLQAHHEELGKGVAGYNKDREFFINVKMKLLKDTGIALLGINTESPASNVMSVADTQSGIRYQLRVDTQTNQIIEYSSNGAPFQKFASPAAFAPSQPDSLGTAIFTAVAAAEPTILAQQKKAALKNNKLEIVERGNLPPVADHPPGHFIVMQEAVSAPGGEAPPQFRLDYNANGDITGMTVKQAGKAKFETTPVARSLLNKILQTKGNQDLINLGITPKDPAQLTPQLTFSATDPGASMQAVMQAYTAEIPLLRQRVRPAPPAADKQEKRKEEALGAGVAILETGVAAIVPNGQKTDIDSLYVVAQMLDDKKQPTGQTYKIYYNEASGFVTRVERKEKATDSFKQVDKAPSTFGIDLKPASFAASLKEFLTADKREQEHHRLMSLTPADMARQFTEKQKGLSAVAVREPSLLDPSKENTSLDVVSLRPDAKTDDTKAKFKIGLNSEGSIITLRATAADPAQKAAYKKAAQVIQQELSESPVMLDPNKVDYTQLRKVVDKVEAYAQLVLLNKEPEPDYEKLRLHEHQMHEVAEKAKEVDAQLPIYEKVAIQEEYNSVTKDKAAYIRVFTAGPDGKPDAAKPELKLFHDDKGSVVAVLMKKPGEKDFLCTEACQITTIQLQIEEAEKSRPTIPMGESDADREKLKNTARAIADDVVNFSQKRNTAMKGNDILNAALVAFAASTTKPTAPLPQVQESTSQNLKI